MADKDRQATEECFPFLKIPAKWQGFYASEENFLVLSITLGGKEIHKDPFFNLG